MEKFHKELELRVDSSIKDSVVTEATNGHRLKLRYEYSELTMTLFMTDGLFLVYRQIFSDGDLTSYLTCERKYDVLQATFIRINLRS